MDDASQHNRKILMLVGADLGLKYRPAVHHDGPLANLTCFSKCLSAKSSDSRGGGPLRGVAKLHKEKEGVDEKAASGIIESQDHFS